MPDASADEAAILELIHRNRIAMWTNDFELWETCFVHAPYTTRWGWWRHGGVFVRQGWDEMRRRVRSGAPPINRDNAYNTKVTNLVLRISGDMAWATYDQHYPHYLTPLHDAPSIVHEARVFERHHGAWKIAFLGLLDGNPGAAGTIAIRLDPDANVLWMGREADEALEAADELVVRGGKLRFRSSEPNRKLQEALRWAASVDNGTMSEHGAVPIIVDAGEGEPTRIYWVVVDAGMIMFSFGDEKLSETRLEIASMIYGLSPAQKQLAALVAEGLSLGQIATRMNITPNTARTHLERIYDKVGVRTQPALVRVLLSAVAPL